MALRALIKYVMDAHHLNADYFAEVVTFTPAGGAPRQVTVHIEENSEYQSPTDLTTDQVDRIIVLAYRDPLATSAYGRIIGGIDTKQVGDQILRAVTKDPEARPYRYEMEFTEQSPDKVRLVYSRHKREAQGMKL